MKLLKFAVLVAVCVSASAQARLEETEQQCEARYGKPEVQDNTPGADKTLRYSKDGIEIFAEFLKGKCVCISYVGPSKMPQEEIDRIFNAEGGITRWANYPRGRKQDFSRSDGLALAGVSQWGDSEYYHRSPMFNTVIRFELTQWQSIRENAIKKAEAARKAAEEAAKKERLKKLEHDS